MDGTRIHAAVGGSGPPVLLLHGYPETHVMWHQVAPTLAEQHTVVLADLRGYGDSARPPSRGDHSTYSKRAMAADQAGLMRHLGFDTFALVGHDRGARVAHRLCLGAPPAYYLRRKLAQWSAGDGIEAFAPEAVDDYVRCFSDPEAIRASCEDYRAGASIDLEHDEFDAAAGRRVECPALVLWGREGYVGQAYDPLEVWKDYATDVRGHPVDGGHFLPEEAPDATT